MAVLPQGTEAGGVVGALALSRPYRYIPLMATQLAPDRDGTVALVGWRRLGRVGPVYEVLDQPPRRQADGDCLMRIRLIETGEEADYRLSDIMDDPREA